MARRIVDVFHGLLFTHDGTLMSLMLSSEERTKAVKEFSDIRHDDVLVWGYPKSGNHFVHDIVRKLQHDGDIELSVKESVDAFLEVAIPDFLVYNKAMETPRSLEDLSKMRSPRVLATHLQHKHQPKLVQGGKCKVIFILRNPKDVAVSFFTMCELFSQASGREMISWDDFIDDFLSGEMVYGSWFGLVKEWSTLRDEPHLLCIRYEDLLKDLKSETRKIAAFIGKDLTEEVLDRVADSCALSAVKLQHPTSPFIRKGVSGGWKEHFTVAQNEKFDKQLQKQLEGTGITFTD